MTKPDSVDRRTVLKTVGAGVVAGTALVGTTTANPRRNFGYVDDTVDNSGVTLTLEERVGREKINCGPANIKTERFSTEEGVDFYGIPSGWEAGDVLETTGFVTGCQGGDDSGKKEVSVTLVEE